MEESSSGSCSWKGTFCLALGCDIAFIAQLNKGRDISVVSTRWDHHLDRFLPPRKWSIPVSGNMELVTADSVANYENGEVEAYIVMASCSSLALALVDISQDNFTIVAQLTYDDSSSAILECLLANGPTTIATFSGKIIIMYPHYVGDSKHGSYCDNHKLWTEDKAVEPMWVAYVLDLAEIHMGGGIRLLFVHDGKAGCTPEAVLGISNACMENISSQQANINLKRSQVEWQYIRFDLYNLGCYLSNVAQNFSGNSVKEVWMQMCQKSDSLLCNELFPAELNPFTISCIKLVPADPASFASAASGLFRPLSESFPDVIIATYDCKVLKCRNGKIIADAYIKNSPVSLTFAVVAQGQGLLLITLAGTEHNVIALCCETLQQLEVWSNVTNVVVGDFQLVGHDQVLLVKSSALYKSVPFPLEDLLCSMFITDFKRSGLVGLNDLQEELKFADRSAAIGYRSPHIQAVARLLETRIEAGKLQEQQLQLQMENKKHLLESSCKLMESVTLRHNLAFIEENSLLATTEGRGLHLVEIEQVYHALHGITWFVIIGVRSRVPRGLILDRATLLLVSVKGQIAGSKSNVQRLDTRDKLYKFVVAVPLQNFVAYPCFPVVNIMLRAGLSCDEIIHAESTKNPNEENVQLRCNFITEKWRCLYTEWLGRICIEENDLLRRFVPQGLSHVIHGVGDSQVFMFRSKGENDAFALISEIKSVLHMEYTRKEYSNSQETKSRISRLVTQSISPFGQADIYIFKDVGFLTLYVEDVELLSRMTALLISHFQHQYDVCQYNTCSCEDMLGSILAFTDRFFQELGVKSSTWQAKHSKIREDQTVQEYHNDLEQLTDEACLHLIFATSF